VCGRLVQALTPEFVAETLEISDSNFELQANYNLAPTQMAGVVRLNPKTNTRSLDALKWWLVPASERADHKFATFNARSEDLTNKKMFRNAWLNGRRCLIPINAYYEWKAQGDGKQPYAIARKDGQPLMLAGLWEGKWLENGDVLRTFTVLTTEAQGIMGELHNRIPVMIEKNSWAGWLGETDIDAAALLHPPDNNALRVWPVSRAVGSVRNNNPELLQMNNEQLCLIS
jgi:putative SOS response-associated peptidase YedK